MMTYLILSIVPLSLNQLDHMDNKTVIDHGSVKNTWRMINISKQNLHILWCIFLFSLEELLSQWGKLFFGGWKQVIDCINNSEIVLYVYSQSESVLCKKVDKRLTII